MLDTITVRQMAFEFPHDIDPVFIDGDHKQSFGFIAGSLLLPYLEPYLIRSMRAAEQHVIDPAVLEDLKKFASQEGQHYQMHKKFNATIRRAGFPELERLEKELADDYQRFTSTKSLRFNLAYAEGFEALTMNVIKHMMGPKGFGDNLPVVMQMIEWHFVEELEHRTVAFDVYDHVCGGYLYRLVVGAWAQWHFTRWIRRATRYMLKTRPQPKGNVKQAAAASNAGPSIRSVSIKDLLPDLLSIYLPGYTPHNVQIPADLQRLAHKYTRMAIKVS